MNRTGEASGHVDSDNTVVVSSAASIGGPVAESRAVLLDSHDALSGNDPTSSAELWQALHQMRLRIAELEVQNDELRRHQASADGSDRRYGRWFLDAPVGQLIVSEAGFVLEGNALTADLLGIDLAKLRGASFVALICHADLDAYYLARRRLLSGGGHQLCHLHLRRVDRRPLAVRLSMGLQTAPDGSNLLHLVIEQSNLFDVVSSGAEAGAGRLTGAGERLRGRGCRDCALRSTCMPRGLSANELLVLDQWVEGRRLLRVGEHLLHSGDAVRKVFVLRSGCLKSTLTQADGSVQIIAFHFCGELIAADSLQQGKERCDVTALQPSQLCAVSHERLQELCERMPTLQFQLLRMMAHELDMGRDHLIAIGQGTALKRVVQFLRSLALRCHDSRLDGGFVALPMTRAEIGNFLGLAEETVCRILKRLEREGLIRLARKKFKVVDESGLSAKFHGDED